MKINKPLIALVIAALPLGALAVRPSSSVVPLTVYDYSSVVDEQDTNAYYGSPDICPATVTDAFTGVSNFRPDTTIGPTTAWDSTFLSPWTTATGLVSGTYDNGTYCSSSSSCLRAEFSTDNKTFSLDTRGTSPARTVTLDFSFPYSGTQGSPFGTNLLPRVGLLQVSSADAITGMQVCTSKGCPEARQMKTTFWFTDPADASVTWRIDWAAIRVLRMSQKTFYFVADVCGGTQVAGLSKLEGTRTKPRQVLNGYYLIPMFFTATVK